MEQKKMISNEVLIYTGGLQIHHIGSWCQGRHYIWLFCICTRLRIRIWDEQACLHLSLSSQKRNVAWAERSMGNDEDIENASRYIFSLVSVELGLCSEVCTWVAKYSGPEHTPCVSACVALFGDKSELAAMNTDSLLMCYNLFWFAAQHCPWGSSRGHQWWVPRMVARVAWSLARLIVDATLWGPKVFTRGNRSN